MFIIFRDYNNLFRALLEFDKIDKKIAYLIIEN